MFLRVKVEKKIRHYTLRSREWINVLHVTPSSEDSPFGLIGRQSRLLLGSTDPGGNVDRKASAAESIPDTLHMCSWRLDGSRCIWPQGWDSNRAFWVSRVEIVPTSLRVEETWLPGASVVQWGSVHTGPVGLSRAPVVTELVVGMCMPTVPSCSLTEHLLPWLLERGTQIGEACDSTSLQTDPIMDSPFPSQFSEDRCM